METKTLQYVSLSEVFQDCEYLLRWFAEYSDFTWGGATFTLVNSRRLSEEVNFAKEYSSAFPELKEQVYIVLGRLSDLPWETMIDLES